MDQTLDGIGYTGPREFDLYWGQCMETDSAHGDIAVNFYFPYQPTLAEGEALMAKIVAYWRSSSTFSNVHASGPGTIQQATTDAPGISLAANAGLNGYGDQVNLTVNTCYNSPGPANPTDTEVGDASS